MPVVPVYLHTPWQLPKLGVLPSNIWKSCIKCNVTLSDPPNWTVSRYEKELFRHVDSVWKHTNSRNVTSVMYGILSERVWDRDWYPEKENALTSRPWWDVANAHSPYISQPSNPSAGPRWLGHVQGGTDTSASVALYSVLSSSSSHNSSSSWSRSAGLRRPPTLESRSRSADLIARSCASFSSAKSSALSPENSLSWIKKSRRFNLNLS